MKVDAGRVVYGIGSAPCTGTGLQWSDDELNAAMGGRVATVLFDDDGKANIEEILVGLAETAFAQDGLRRVLEDPDEIEDWRVGEAIAETYLTDHRSCIFPWPHGRDERKSGSSLPGADLVGFGTDDAGDCLAFGEVKTSRERKYPPGTMYGRTGLKQQLEDLRDREAIRHDLMKYLGHRARSANWRGQFERAAIRYLRNTSDVQLYGFLVRDVAPHPDDLRVRIGELGAECPDGTRIELLALYLPPEKLDGIGTAMISRRAGVER
ncbi:MAG: hypothetical protein F4Z04_10210 [Acidobacteria bacterium]|nr:hypothetical protein [Acidobacteriota bacterium]